MKPYDQGIHRRDFLKAALTATAASVVAGPGVAQAAVAGRHLQVWSCGGLAEAMSPAHEQYEQRTGVLISYTGAFAAALGKSLLGSATTEVFAGRVLDLAKKLRAAGKMEYFKPLCFTSYVLATPKGNPAGIQSVQDLAKPGVRVAMAPDASPPGGQAAEVVLKKAGVLEEVKKNVKNPGSCVQRSVEDVVNGQADAMIVELRVTKLKAFVDKLEVVLIPENYFPPPPLTFTIGVMKDAKDRKLADDYVAYMTSAEGQVYFERQGFISAISDKGKELVEKLGVKDV